MKNNKQRQSLMVIDELSSDNQSSVAALDSFLTTLPSLPSALRYYDDFLGQQRSISDLFNRKVLPIHTQGNLRRIYLSRYPKNIEILDLRRDA